MPRGPQGQRRPADTVGCAITVARIATGEIDDSAFHQSGKVRSGRAGAAARTKNLSSDRRTEIAKRAAMKRWGKS